MKSINTIILGILLLFSITSCNSVLNKSISEPLTLEEVEKAVQKDYRFSFTYKFVEMHRNYLQTESQKVMWKDLTYSRLHKFINTVVDTTFQKTHEEEFAKKWELQYGQYKASVDSVYNIWQKYWDTHQAASYVRVELIDIEKEYMESVWGGGPIVTSRDFVMKVIPLRGTVDCVSFDYDLFEMDEEPSFSDLFSHYHSVQIDKAFSAPVVVKDYPTVSFEKNEMIKSSDFKTVLSKYKFGYFINYVIVNGKRVDMLSLRKAIPDVVFEYMRHKRNKKASDFDKEYSFKRVVEEILKKEYESKDTYIYNQMCNICKEIDELAFQFYSL